MRGTLCHLAIVLHSWGSRWSGIFPCRWLFSENGLQWRCDDTHGLIQLGRWSHSGKEGVRGTRGPRKVWLCIPTSDRNRPGGSSPAGQRCTSESTDLHGDSLAGQQPGSQVGLRLVGTAGFSPGPRCSLSTGVEHVLGGAGQMRSGEPGRERVASVSCLGRNPLCHAHSV